MFRSVNELTELLNNLDEHTKPLWGSMTPHKMVEHLISTFQISNGKMQTVCFSEEKKIPVLKKILMSNRQMPKNFDIPANKEILKEYKYENFEAAKLELVREAIDYYRYFEEYPDNKLINPTFGQLNKVEWEQFHRKHITHHLTQFGLIK